MKFASLGSGSEGNALLISSATTVPSIDTKATTIVMLDCGFGIKEAERRLARLALAPSDLTAIVVTHEHQDHIGGVFKLARRYALPVWLTHGTYQAVLNSPKFHSAVQTHFCRDGETVGIGDLQLTPYTVPHDAREPVQYVASDGNSRLGVLTDAGKSTDHLIRALGGCHALVLECNHDQQMLRDSAYPPSLKRRIGGEYGHLSNDAAADILAALDQSLLRKVIGAHLSARNNAPALALAALQRGRINPTTELTIACQDDGFDWIDI
ncbi:MBL fold metallo-hydrolase [Glaciimonas sp. PAMC28666]|uniref:MBL fold metallo-hydrolase n=1 Tax=Glaciimonas sp. PAMC28666 TaxID=2807626 RepID=UPI001962E996|nr:MBL fold metallo-hydrolase [Glaciimonas sp. PAMC28666]QRX82542.1 MBL fold metallo-hydrolase [Glaciimonas sp. PAMC28666]